MELYDDKPHDSDNEDYDSNYDYESYGGYADSDDSDPFMSYARAVLDDSDADKMWYQYTYLYN